MLVIISNHKSDFSYDYRFKVAPGVAVELNDAFDEREAIDYFNSARKHMFSRYRGERAGTCTVPNFKKFWNALINGDDIFPFLEILGWTFLDSKAVTSNDEIKDYYTKINSV